MWEDKSAHKIYKKKIERLAYSVQEFNCSLHIIKQLSRYKVTIVMFCGQNEVVTSRTKTVAVTVVVWKELL